MIKEKPVLGITMGDPAGNGPELSAKVLAKEEVYQKCRPILIGDAVCLEKALKITGNAEKLTINPVKNVEEAEFQYGKIDILDMKLIDKERHEFGKISSMCGNAAFQYVKKDIELAMAGKVDATVTNALNKEAMNLADHHFSGHTEIYAHYTNTSKYTMMLIHEGLRVVHVSTHVSLREACDRVKKERVLEVIRIADAGCKALGIPAPKIGVAGLNPHCGENGIFGREELDEIQPAINQAMEEGIVIPEGKPTPPDTIFSKALGGWYDIVVAMYHDQGHIPLKVKGFVYNQELKCWDAVAGVNITLGIPVIRTSVDHGTGFDRAGDGSANELSLMNAIEYAVLMANTNAWKDIK